jgi:hypothetical protein
MDSAFLESLISGAGPAGRLVGGWVVAVLYLVIGLLAAAGSILVFRRVFRGRWEPIFWAAFLVVIAAFYLAFAAWFEATSPAWWTEAVAVVVFLACAVGGLFHRAAIAAGYALHGLWDLTHSLAGTSLDGLALTDIPLGYPLFCLGFDLTVAVYLLRPDPAWREPGRFDPLFWRN